MGFDRFGGKRETGSHLAVCIAQAGKRGNISLSPGEGLPLGPEFFNGSVLGKAGGQDIGDHFVFRTAFVLG